MPTSFSSSSLPVPSPIFHLICYLSPPIHFSSIQKWEVLSRWSIKHIVSWWVRTKLLPLPQGWERLSSIENRFQNSTHVPETHPDLTARSLTDQATQLWYTYRGFMSVPYSTLTAGTDSICSQELRSVIPVGSSIMTLTLLASIIPLPFLQGAPRVS